MTDRGGSAAANAPRLVLFDVDGTLIRRGDPAHLGAIDAGFRAAFPSAPPVSVREIDYDGRLDRQLLRALLAAAGLNADVPAEALQPAFAAATTHYAAIWEGLQGAEDLLPGVLDLLERLRRDARFRLGVLTGGTRGIVEVKLRRLGLAGVFPVGAFGDEVEERADLLPLAASRAALTFGSRFNPEQTVVIGDTPRDITCAIAGYAASLGVATGRYTADELRAAGASAVLPDLTDTERVVKLLLDLTDLA